MYRNDLLKICNDIELLINNRIDFDMLYSFLLDVCKAENIRPKDLNAHIERNWLKVGKHSALSIEPIHFNDKVKHCFSGSEIDYEELILARQETEYID